MKLFVSYNHTFRVLLLVLVLLPCVAKASISEIKITPGDGKSGDKFGLSLDVSGNFIISGSFSDSNGFESGAAYLFDVTTGNQITKLIPNDAQAGDLFGRSVEISGNVAIIGSYFDDDNGDQSGSAYLFDITTGNQLSKLLPNDGHQNGWFGTSLAMSGNTALVGSPGASNNASGSSSAYLFDVTTGNQISKLTPTNGVPSDRFGESVAISGNTAIVGSFWDNPNGSHSGSVYLFDITTGEQTMKLIPDDGQRNDWFGKSIAVSDDIVIVSSRNAYGGSAYLFDITTGNQVGKLMLQEDDMLGGVQSFGNDVDIFNDIAIVARRSDGLHAGAVYLFDVTTGDQIVKLTAGDSSDYSYFGSSVSIIDGILVVGATGRVGSAYIYNLADIIPEPASFLILFFSCTPLICKRNNH